ncbi:zinc finger, CCHC-type containing protein [Tanacetum coccineum]
MPTALHARFIQELNKLHTISTYIDSRLESINQLLNGFTQQPNEIDVDDLESNDELVDTPLVSPFLDSNDDFDDGEVLNELEEYEGLESTGKNLVAIVRDVYVFVGSFTYITDFVILEDIGEFILSNMAEVVMGKPFRKITKLEYDYAKELMSFTRIFDNYTFQMPHSIPSLSFLCDYLFFNPLSLTSIGDENPIRTLGDYSKPSHEGNRNTIELPKGNNVVPLRSDTIQLVQIGCSFRGIRSQDPIQHLKDLLKLVDLLDLDVPNRERTRIRLFQFSFRDQASNWLEYLIAGSISTWDDLTTRFLAQFFLPRRTVKLKNDILMFQQHQGESLSEAWTRFKDLLQKVPHHSIDRWLQVQIFYDHVNPATRRTIDQRRRRKTPR